MKSILEMILTPQFLIGTIVAGILVNLVSHWLISKFPNKAKSVMSKLSENWATRTKELRTAREKRITDIMNSPQEQTFLITSATNKMINGFIQLALTLFLGAIVLITINGLGHYKEYSVWNLVALVVNLLFFAPLACICFHVMTQSFHEAEEMRRDVEEARRRLKMRIN